MRKSILAAAVAAALVSPVTFTSALAQAAAAPASPHTLTGNVGFVSDYRFRSISQTYKQPALQGGFDYSHSSGFYAGTWASNVSNTLYPNGNNMEWDFYAGWKAEVAKDLTLDVGILQYWYPGSRYYNFATAPALTTTGRYNNTELYIAASWKWLTAKYNYAVSDYFGLNSSTMLASTFGTTAAAAPSTSYCGTNSANAATGNGAGAASGSCIPFNSGNSKGSGYLDLSANFDLGSGWGLNGHVGNLRVKNYSAYNYTDYKLGVTKDLGGGFTLGASAIGNNAKTAFYTVGPVGTTETKNLRSSTLVVSIIKTF